MPQAQAITRNGYDYGPPVVVYYPGGAPLNATGEIEDGGGGGSAVVVAPPAVVQKPEGGADLIFGYQYLNAIVGTASTPDPGPLPSKCVFVFKARIGPGLAGPVLTSQDVSGDRAWVIGKYNPPGWTWNEWDTGLAMRGAFAFDDSVVDGNEETWALSIDHDNGAGLFVLTPYKLEGGWIVLPAATVPTYTPFDGSAPVRIGANWTTSNPWDGRIYSVELKTGLDPAAGMTTGRYLVPTIGAVSTPDPGPIPTQCTVVFKVRNVVAGTEAMHTIACQWPPTSWMLQRWEGHGGAVLFASPDGTATNNCGAPLGAITPAADETLAVSIDFADVTTQRMRGWRKADGTWTPQGYATAGVATAGVFDSSAAVIIGKSGYGGDIFDGRIYSVEMRTGLDPAEGARYLMPRSVVISPDTPDLAIGSERVRLTVRLSADTFSASVPTILGKFGPEGREYLMYGYTGNVINGSVGALEEPGTVDFSIYPSAPVGVPLTMASEFQHGSDQVTVTLDDGSHSTATLAQVAHIVNTSGDLYIGSLDGSSSFRIYWAQLERLDAGGNVTGLVWRFDAAEAPTDATTTTWTDPRGRTWTVNSPAAISGRTIWKFDAGDAPADATTTSWTDPRGRTWTATNPHAIAGRTVWKFDAEDVPEPATPTYVDPRGRQWTLTNTAAIGIG